MNNDLREFLNELNIVLSTLMLKFSIAMMIIGGILLYTPIETWALKLVISGYVLLWYAIIASLIFNGDVVL